MSRRLPEMGAHPARRARIGLTPLIDVVFILLIFFMLASRFADHRALPLDAASAGAGAGPEGALLVEIRRDGLRLSGEALAPDALAARLAAHLRARPDLRVLLAPAPGVDLQAAVAALDLLASAGARDVALLGGG